MHTGCNQMYPGCTQAVTHAAEHMHATKHMCRSQRRRLRLPSLPHPTLPLPLTPHQAEGCQAFHVVVDGVRVATVNAREMSAIPEPPFILMPSRTRVPRAPSHPCDLGLEPEH